MTAGYERITHPEFPRLTILRRKHSKFYHAQTFIDGKLQQGSLRTSDFTLALRIAREWYKRTLRASVSHGQQHPIDKLTSDPLLAEVFRGYRSTLTEKQQAQADMRWGPIQHFWRSKALSEITSETFSQFFTWRKTVKAHTIHKDVCLIRQILKYAETKTGTGFTLPRIPKFGRIEPNPRPWLSKAEWNALKDKAEERQNDSKISDRTARQRYDCWQFALFMLASMCRVDDLKALRFRDCQIEEVEGREILRCEFTAKKHVRIAYASAEAVHIYKRRLKASGGDMGALVFPEHHRDAFRELLIAAGLYKDRFGNTRNYKAVRATSITFALLRPNPPSIYQIALNAGTSVAVIEKFYAKRLTAESGKDILTATEPLNLFGATKKRKKR